MKRVFYGVALAAGGENRPDPLQAVAMGHDAPPMGPDERSSSR
ncbi:hypothetical protein C351_05556 [Cryptococcus neoformans c8]|nr:hypothetical protein C351_05556 [Cryptococcus neoformans var. grubii c8]